MAQAAVARSLSPTSELSKSYISPRLKGREVFPFGLTAYPNRVGTAEVREENGISAPCGPKPAFAGGVMPAFLLDCSDRRGIRTSVATTNINQPFSGLHSFILNLPLPPSGLCPVDFCLLVHNASRFRALCLLPGSPGKQTILVQTLRKWDVRRRELAAEWKERLGADRL